LQENFQTNRSYIILDRAQATDDKKAPTSPQFLLSFSPAGRWQEAFPFSQCIERKHLTRKKTISLHRFGAGIGQKRLKVIPNTMISLNQIASRKTYSF
jgi:hypothetical protein